MKIAVEGCCHGELDNIYAEIARLEKQKNYKIDLLLICGDFQAVRNPGDLEFMAVPSKYKRLGEFYKYYTGEKRAPVTTIVIGGNHEASNYMWELYHGGWLAPKIYYLGEAGCVKANGLRIAGISGIFQPDHYPLGHYERFPYNGGHMRSIYHTRVYDIQRLKMLDSPDIVMSHDWPLSIEQYGDLQTLLSNKPYFKREVKENRLGSPPLLELLRTIRPAHWFSAHLHVRYTASFNHDSPKGHVQTPSHSEEIVMDEHPKEPMNPDEIILEDDEEPTGNPDEIMLDDVDEEAAKVDESVEVVHGGLGARERANPDEIMLDEEDDEDASQVAGLLAMQAPDSTPIVPPPSARKVTQFLALDKCLPRRKYLEIIDIPLPEATEDGVQLTFDAEWLGITKAFHPYLSLQTYQPMPDLATIKEEVEKQIAWVKENVPEGGEPPVSSVQQFQKTAPGGKKGPNRGGVQWYTNPQTEAFCKLLGVTNVINAPPTDYVPPADGSAVPADADATAADAEELEQPAPTAPQDATAPAENAGDSTHGALEGLVDTAEHGEDSAKQ